MTRKSAWRKVAKVSIFLSWPEADPLKDMDDFAAQVCALDLGITVDNSTAHLAGALGVQCWVLLPRPWDWRWFGYSPYFPWYSSIRLFRQSTAGTWDDVFENVLMQLHRLNRPAGRKNFKALPGPQSSTEQAVCRNNSRYSRCIPLKSIFPAVVAGMARPAGSAASIDR